MEENINPNKIFFFDTTLRDGQQTTGVDFSVDDKIKFSSALDELGIDYVEGGWPGSNPTDDKWMQNLLLLLHAPKNLSFIEVFSKLGV